MISITFCKTGLQRHAPELIGQLSQHERVTVDTTECFDKCESCEFSLLARINGAMVRLKSAEELLHSIEDGQL